MGDYVHRTTKQYLKSVSPNSLPEPLVNYIEDPDLSNVVGVPSIYWIITGDVITEMTQGEKDAVDAAILSAARDGEMQAEIDNLESVVRQLTKLTVDELNILRALHSLPDRTMTQVRDQLRADLGT
jgi:hypothetical protein